MALLPILMLLATVGTTPPEAKFIQVAPHHVESKDFQRSIVQDRAVVLIQGLDLHVFKDAEVARAKFRAWQLPGAALVEALAKDADVFAFAYGQTVPVDEIASGETLVNGVRRLREMGYVHVVLVGHGAGGIVARQFVEDHPDAGVTKVVQICTPNGGSSWTKLHDGLRPSQRDFVTSLSREVRTEALKKRNSKLIPDSVQFVCVLGNGLIFGDGVVACDAQWPVDLQALGIPVVCMRTDHFLAVRTRSHAVAIAELVRGNHPRLSIAEVEEARRKVLKKSVKEGAK